MKIMTAVVSYPSNHNLQRKFYEFKTDLELKTGDWVVVNDVNGYSLVQVEGVSEEVSVKSTKWVVCKVDTAAHEARLKKEEEIKSIKAKLEVRRKKLEEVQVYRILAQEDEEMAMLLKELDAHI